MLRQGDVMLIPADRAPEDGLPAVPGTSTAVGRLILAYGEATGHAHVLAPDGRAILCAPAPDDGRAAGTLVVMDDGVELRHEEHAPLPVPAGTYRVVLQRRYDPRLDDRAARVGD